MTLAFEIQPPAAVAPASSAHGWRIERAAMSPALVQEWDALSDAGVASPYQGRAWVMGFLKHVSAPAGCESAIVAVRDNSGALVGLFPLAVRVVSGARVAGFVGDKHANHHMPLLAPAFAATLDAQRVRALLKDVAHSIGDIDAFTIINQPECWAGRPNPLAAIASWRAAQSSHALALTPSAETALERSLSTHARKKLRSKRKKFEEAGKLSVLFGDSPERIAMLSEAFLRQKAERLRDLGIDDPFAEDGVMEMLRAGALPDADGPPSIEWHGLGCDGRVVAVFIGAVNRTRYAGMATSFEQSDEIARTSPGELLLHDLILDQGRRGRAMFDLGVGDARYKTTFCDQTEPMVETVMPLSARGYRILALALARRIAKQAVLAVSQRWPGMAKAARRLVTRPSG